MTILFPPKPNKHSLDLTFPPETDPEGDNHLSLDGLAVSEADYWQDYYLHAHPHDFTYEWHHGILEVKPMADLESALMSRWFTQLLEQFLLVNPVAQVTLLEIGFRLAVPQSTSIRRPDMGLILNSNPVQMALTDHNYQGIFDICIEFLSHSSQKDIHRDTIQKKGEYEQAGVQEYYILDGRGIETAFYEQTASGVYRPLPQPGGIMQSQALVGFQFRINDLYHRPPLMSLVDDPVYQGFVLRDYQAERSRANQEQQRADQEQQRADHAEHKIFDIVRRTMAFRFQLPLDHFDQELQGLDVSALTVLSDALFEVADLAEFKAQLAQFVSSKK